jgi:hypothetical protein
MSSGRPLSRECRGVRTSCPSRPTGREQCDLPIPLRVRPANRFALRCVRPCRYIPPRASRTRRHGSPRGFEFLAPRGPARAPARSAPHSLARRTTRKSGAVTGSSVVPSAHSSGSKMPAPVSSVCSTRKLIRDGEPWFVRGGRRAWSGRSACANRCLLVHAAEKAPRATPCQAALALENWFNPSIAH